MEGCRKQASSDVAKDARDDGRNQEELPWIASGGLSRRLSSYVFFVDVNDSVVPLKQPFIRRSGYLHVLHRSGGK